MFLFKLTTLARTNCFVGYCGLLKTAPGQNAEFDRCEDDHFVIIFPQFLVAWRKRTPYFEPAQFLVEDRAFSVLSANQLRSDTQGGKEFTER